MAIYNKYTPLGTITYNDKDITRHDTTWDGDNSFVNPDIALYEIRLPIRMSTSIRLKFTDTDASANYPTKEIINNNATLINNKKTVINY